MSAEKIIEMTESGPWSRKLPVCPKITPAPTIEIIDLDSWVAGTRRPWVFGD